MLLNWRGRATQQWEIQTVSDFGDYPKGRLQDYTPPQSPYNSAMPHTASEAYGSCRGRPVMSPFVVGQPANIQLSHNVAMLYWCTGQEGMDGRQKSWKVEENRRRNYPWWGFGKPLDHKVVQLVVTTTFGGSDMSRFVRTDHPQQAGRVCATDPVWAGTSVDRGQEVQHNR